MAILEYKGYQGTAEINLESEMLCGRVVGLKNVVMTFEGITVKALKVAFEETVDDYLEWCKEEGEEPEKPERYPWPEIKMSDIPPLDEDDEVITDPVELQRLIAEQSL